MPPQFARPAAFGDLLTALLALASLLAVMRKARGARLLVWLFNVAATVDLLDAIPWLALKPKASPSRAQRVGRRVLVKRSDLENYLEANPIEATIP